MNIFKNKQEEKFMNIYYLYVDEIYQFIYLRTGMSEATAEDLTQDIFIDVYKGISKFRGLSSERTWIFKIAKNKLNDFYRKHYNSKFKLIEFNENIIESLNDQSQDIQKNMETAFEKEKIRECLNNLPEQYRIILVLKYIDEKTIKELAVIFNKTPKAIESHLQRAKNAFIKNYLQVQKKEEL